MRFFSQSYLYEYARHMFLISLNTDIFSDAWSIVTLAFFLRYPNPYASHVISCDVIARECTPSGTLLTKRLILKKGNVPRWFPKGIVSRAESWIIEESEVDPYGKMVNCVTKNLDHVKVMQVQESVKFAQTPEGYVCFTVHLISHILLYSFVRKTLQQTEARIISNFGWGLTKQIENHGLNRFKANLQRVSLILRGYDNPIYPLSSPGKG